MYPLSSFGYKTAWLAARGCTPEALADALGFTTRRDSTPQDAVAWMYEGGMVAVLPPLPGVGGMWTLATGMPMFDISPDTAAALSHRLNCPIQVFGTHRVVEYHLWMLADHGQLVRQFCYLGEQGTMKAWAGRPTPAELALGLPDVDWFDSEDDAFDAGVQVNEDTVMQVAAAWSLDPTTLEHASVNRQALLCAEPSDPNWAGRGYSAGGPRQWHPADQDDSDAPWTPDDANHSWVSAVKAKLFGRGWSPRDTE